MPSASRSTRLYSFSSTLSFLLASCQRTSLWEQSDSMKMTSGSLHSNFPRSTPLRNVGLERRQPGKEDGKWAVWIREDNTDGPSAGRGHVGMAMIRPGTQVWLQIMAYLVQENKTGPHASFLSVLLFLSTPWNSYCNLFLPFQDKETHLWLSWRHAYKVPRLPTAENEMCTLWPNYI